jgi:phage/plasmid-like protein (TIGR03299 family)
MAHEIRTNDGLVLARHAAWHGLGTVVESAPNPFAALRLANLEWQVEESAHLVGVYNPGESHEFRVSTDRSKILVRSDDKSVLGVVGRDYCPVQNQTLAELAWALRDSASDAGVKIESAGSIRGGQRVWFLVQAPSIEIGARGDITNPYLMLTNGHDGGESLKAFGTGVRVVCANTYRMALGQAKDVISFRHTSGINERVETLKTTINQWFKSIETGRQFAASLAARPMTRAQVQDLWVEVIQRLDGEIPAKPTNGWEERSREQAVAGLAHMAKVFDVESQRFGANLWVAANAATNWIQHVRSDYSVRAKDVGVRRFAAWNGTVADDTAEVWKVAAQHA